MNKPTHLLAAILAGVSALVATSLALAAGADPTPLTNNSVRASVSDQNTWRSKRDVLDELRDAYGMNYLEVGDVLADTNRNAVEKRGDVELFCSSSKSAYFTQTYDADFSFTWKSDDAASTGWYPQGITGSGEAKATGLVGDKRALLVSWYAKDGSKHEGKGARISFVDVTNLDDVTYRHTLLVEPYIDGRGMPNFRAVQTHAGGIAWYGRYLYVADTYGGFRVFDLRRIMKTTYSSDKSKIGVIGDTPYAHGYVYVVPMVSRYLQPSPPSFLDWRTGKLSTDEYMRLREQQFQFSFISVDRTTSPHNLVAGEYEDGTDGGRFTRWELDGDNQRIGASRSFGTKNINRTNTQGVASAYGTWFYNHTYSKDQYRIHMQLPDGSVKSIRGGYGLEDMYYNKRTKRLWMHTEHPGSRKVFYKEDPINAWANGDPDGNKLCFYRAPN